MTRRYPPADVKKLYGRAAARCALCRAELVLESTSHDSTKQIGKIAHIVAHSENGPRSDPDYPKDELDKYENWILLCPTCHEKVDAQENTYTVQRLRELKRNHEEWVRNSLEDNMPEFGFAELEVAVKGIANMSDTSSTEFSVLPPDEKISRNGLTAETRNLLVMGLMRSKEVDNYLNEMDIINAGFADQITAAFQKQYIALRGNGLSGDALFEVLFDFASGGSSDFKIRAAGLALLSHLFEICEVFEK